MALSFDEQFHSLRARLAVDRIGIAEINAATDFAIDANAARRTDLTLALLQPLAERAPGVVKIWQLLGLAWREEQVMEHAIECFEKASQLAPQDVRIALGKAQLAMEVGRPAAASFQMIRAVAPQDGELALSTAAAFVHEGQMDAADALVEGLLVQNPGWLRGHDWLAATRWMQGDRACFARSYVDAVAAYPADKAFRLGWYRAVAQAGLWEEADRIIADARRYFGNQIEFDAAEAHIASESGDDERAARLFARLPATGDPGIAIAQLRHCLRLGTFDEAEAIATPLLGGPSANAVWPYMSSLWRLTGNPRAAWLDGEPAFVRQYDLPVTAAELAALAATLRRLHQMRHHPPEQSLRGGTQTQGHLFLRLEPELLAIRASILEAVRDYVAELPPFQAGHPLLGTPRSALQFEGAWSVRLTAQGFHVVHTHPVGWISSAFYVSLPESMGTAPAGCLQLGAPPADLRLDLAPYIEIEPKPGRLALFPSTMWHGTVPFDDGERLTIAFDMRIPSR